MVSVKLRAVLLATLVGFAAFTGSVTLTGVGAAANAGNTALSDSSDSPVSGAGNVPVAQLELRSDDTPVNDHDGIVDARLGDTVGAFGSDAFYYDADGSTDYTTGDEVVLDNDGDAAYTAERETLVSGLAVGSAVTTADGFDSDWSLDSYDADETDGAWDGSEDAIVIESGSGGTYSTGADTILNAGPDTFVNSEAGDTLKPMSDIDRSADGPHLVDSNGNGAFDDGEDTVEDLDENDRYTAQADTELDANAGSGTNDPAFATFDAPAGASMTGAETVSIPAGGDAPSNGYALYYVDSDDSGGYTTSDELVLDPNAGNMGSLTYDADDASDEDGDGVAGDDVLLFKGDDFDNQATEGDTLHQFTASDHVAFEDSGHDGIDDGEYQKGEEIYVDYNNGGTVSQSADTVLNEDKSTDRTAGDPLVPLNGLDSPSNLRWYDEDSDDGYDADDEIIVDNDQDGVYTTGADSVVVGQPPSEGASLATGQDGDWSIDSHDAVDGNGWDVTTDGLFVDGGDGAYSTDDTLVAGERISGGTAVTTAGAFDSDWSLDSYDTNGTDGSWDDSEDAVILERGNDEYDAGHDTSLNTGTDGDIDSPDGRAIQPMEDLLIGENGFHLVDANGNGEFDPGEDVVSDLDEDDQYTARADTGIDNDGTSSQGDYGDITVVRSLSVIGAETVSPAAAADGGSAPDNGNALYYVDSDGSGDYSADDELVLEPNAGSTNSLTLDTDPASDTDGDGTAGDDVILSSGQDGTNGASDGDTLHRFTASDHVAFEDDGVDGTDDGQYQDGEDVLVDYDDGGTVSKGTDPVTNDGGSNDRSAGDPLIRLDRVDEPAGVGWLDEDTNGVYTSGDEIVLDEPDDDTFTAGVDRVVGGTAPPDGASLPTGESMDSDWEIDSYDDNDGGPWNGTSDALFIDTNGGGTFSATADTRINAGEDGTFDVSNGESLADLDESAYGYVDVDGDGPDTGDEVYEEGDAASPSGAGTYGETLTDLTVEQTGTLETEYIERVSLYRDDGDGTLEPGTDDTLVQSGASPTGDTYTFTGLDESVGTDETSYIVAVDLATDAPDGETVEFAVPAAGISFAQSGAAGSLGWDALEIDGKDPTFEGGTTASATVDEGTTGVVRDVDAAGDTDSDYDSDVTYSLAGPDAETFSIDSETGELSLDSPQDFEAPTDDDGDGAYELTVTATDDAGATATQDITVTLRDRDEGGGGGGGGGYDPNDPPTATNDSYTTTANTTLSVAAEDGVLANDSDPDPDDDSDGLSVAVASGPENGTLSLATNGAFTYTPDAEFVGNDSFTYKVSDGNGGDDTATATITVTQRPPRVSDPIVLENDSEIRQQLPIPANASLSAVERVTIADNGTGPVTANFTANSTVRSVQFTTNTSGNLTVVEYGEPPSVYDDVPGSMITSWRMAGSPAVEDAMGTVHVAVSQSELRAVDAEASALRITRRVDGSWRLINTSVVSQDTESVRLAATTDSLSSFAVTTVKPPNASLTVTPTPTTVSEEFTLDATGTTAPDGAVVSYEWSVAGQSLAGETATTTLAQGGEYTVELTVTTDTGRTDTATTNVVVETETAAGTTPESISSQTSSPTETTTRTMTGGSGPDFDIIIVLVALAGATLLVLRKIR